MIKELDMNKMQKFILFLTAIALVVMMCYPPFMVKTSKIDIYLGYKLINLDYVDALDATREIVHIKQLCVQYLFVMTIGGLLFFIFKSTTVRLRIK